MTNGAIFVVAGTTRHIMSRCDKFAVLRQVFLGDAFPQPPYLMPISRVITFLQALQIPSLEIYKNQQAYQDQFGSDSDESG